MDINFQKGEYPIKQVFFVGIDSVLGGLLTSTLFKPKYGRIDIIHQLMESHPEAKDDISLLKLTTHPVVTTCWSSERLTRSLRKYLQWRGWKKEDIRVYELGRRVEVRL